MPMSGSASRDTADSAVWWFVTGRVKQGSCAIYVYVPKSQYVRDSAGRPATYHVIRGRSNQSVTNTFRITQPELRGRWIHGGTFPVSNGQIGVSTVWHDFSTTPHLTVLGDTESGKTNLLRLVARAVIQNYTPEQARVMVIDLRRELYDVVPPEYQLGYAVSAALARQIVTDAATALTERQPDESVTPAQLRRRDWWTGPELFLLIDDYDLLAGSMDSPFSPLLDLIPQATDIGLRVVLARGAAGSSRTSMDPFMRRLQESNAPDLALSCPPSEGMLMGNVRARQLPPGRAMLLTRRGHSVIQTALVETAES